jgi:NAD+ kinase
MDRLGLVVHPKRPVDRALEHIREWAAGHGVGVRQVQTPGYTRQVADPVEAADCDVLLALGGDGTTLIALHAGAAAGRPVLGVACGSRGVLAAVPGDRVTWALDQIASGAATRAGVPGLDVVWDGGANPSTAINDVAVLRGGPGQLLAAITVDDVLYARIAGDGLVAATPLGSSAYTMAAGGPILAPGAPAIAVTPLATHGGSVPPLVVGAGSRLVVTLEPGHGGVRCEIDGRAATVDSTVLTVGWRPDYASMVIPAEAEPRLTNLRRRGIVLDSPRVLVRDGRR